MSGDPYDGYTQSFGRFPDVIYFPQMGLAMPEPRVAITETTRGAISWSPDFSHVPGYGVKGGQVVFDHSIAARTRQIAEPVLLTTHGSSMVYGHWVADTLPSAYLWRAELASGAMKLMLPFGRLRDWQRDSLAALGIPSSALISPEAEVLCLADAIVSSSCGMGNVVCPPEVTREMGDYLVRSIGGDRSRQGNRLIYISRRRDRTAGSKRDLVNDEELLAELQPLGFEIVSPGELQFRDQIEIFSQAKVIVAPHGSALINVIFAPVDTAVVDLMPESWTDTVHSGWIYRVTNVLSQRYLLMLGEMRWKFMDTDGVENVAVTNQGTSYRIDIERALAAIKSLL